jgi:hypothetical protein
MKRFALAFCLLPTLSLFAASDKANPADFTVKVHVVSSYVHRYEFSGIANYDQVLETTIDNQPVELTGGSRGVLALGDYPARISEKVHGPKNPNSYDVYRGYDLLMPDGSTRLYTVTGLGPSPSHP